MQNSKRSSYAALFLVYYFSFCFIHPIVADEFAEIHSPYSYFRGIHDKRHAHYIIVKNIALARTRRVSEFYDEQCCSGARKNLLLFYVPIACDFRPRRYPMIQNFDTIRIYTVPSAVEAAANGPGSWRPLSCIL
uniref:Uncharacterized protein n=1 Tax=Trichogramma kaykai TaxID=54128 RepID=A0ABD2VV21_9HYME